MKTVYLDWETYYDKVYNLRKMTTQEYILDERFEVTALSIAVDDGPVRVFTKDQVPFVLARINWDDACLVAHNTIFDGAILSWIYGYNPKLYACTLSMARAVFGTLLKSNGLGELSKLVGMHKDTEALMDMSGVRADDMDTSDPSVRRFLAYAGSDTETCRRLYKLMLQGFPAKERIVMDIVLRMFIDGWFELDRDMLLEAITEESEQRQEYLQAAGVQDVGDLRSRDRFAILLQNLGVDTPTKTSPSTGKQTYAFAKNDIEFTKLLEHDNPRVVALVEAKLNASSTINESRCQRFINIHDNAGGRLHVPLLYSGAHTHRFSGLDKLNLQNIPAGRDGREPRLRKSLKARKGRKVVVVDAAQIEARLVVWMAGQRDLVRAFAQGRDVYAEFASMVYGYEVTKANHPLERFIGKQGILGLGYNAGGPKFHFMLVTTTPRELGGYKETEERSTEIVRVYRSGYDKIPRLWRIMDDLIVDMFRGNTVSYGPISTRKNQILLPSGLTLSFPHLRPFEKYNKERGKMDRGWEFWKPRYKCFMPIYGGKLLENICQALARIQISDTMVWIKLHHPDWKCLLQVHDEVVYDVAEDEAEFALDTIVERMSTPGSWAQCFDYPLPLAAEGDIGDTYGDAK